MASQHESGAAREEPREILAMLRRAERSGDAPRYERLTEVAKGGMGIVYSVRDRDMRRKVAMKVLRSRAEPPADEGSASWTEVEARFVEEAQLTSQLDHPGIVPVHEMGITADGQLFFTMRLVQGRTLADVFDDVAHGEAEWTRTRALGVMQRVCEALAYAHERGVIHRDLKPANVMVGRFGETYVMDWGLAKVINAPETRDLRLRERPESIVTSVRGDAADDDEESALLTMDGDVMGTPSYMPPEQARGELERLDRRADVYAVGAMLYHLIAGHVPYAMQGSALEVLERLRAGPPAPLPTRGVPEELIAITERAMQREPEARYGDMREVADDLRAFLEHRVVAAHRTGAWAELAKWFERNRALASAITAALLVALGSLVAIGVVQTRARADLQSANGLLQRANRETVEALGVAKHERSEARWQSYVANVVAASASLERGAAGDAAARLEACAEEHRGWEWRFLRNSADTSLDVWTASEDSFAHAVDWSANGRVAVAVGPAEGARRGLTAVRIFDEHTGDVTAELTDFGAAPVALEFGAEGRRLLVLTETELLVHDLERGTDIWRSERVGFPALAPDGAHIAAAWNDLWIVALATGEERSLVTDRSARCAAFSPDGLRLACGTREGELLLVDVASGTVELDIQLTDGEQHSDWNLLEGVIDVEFLDDGARLAAALDEGAVAIVDTQSGDVLQRFEVGDRPVTSVAASPLFAHLAAASDDGTLTLWDLTSGALLDRLHGHDARVTDVVYAPDGRTIATTSLDQTVRMWDAWLGASALRRTGEVPTDMTYAYVAFDPASKRLLWHASRGALCITDLRAGLDLVELGPLDTTPRGAAFVEGGDEVVTVSAPGRVRRWDASTGELLAVSRERLPFLMYVDFAPDGERFVACTSSDASWDPREGEAIQVRSTDDGTLLLEIDDVMAAWYVRFGPRGERIYAGHLDGVMRAYDARDGALLLEFDHDALIHDIAPAPSGEWIATVTHSTWDKALYIWDAATGARRAVHHGHAQPILLAVAPDSRRVASSNWDGTMTLWDPVRGELLSLGEQAGKGCAIVFSPDGARLAFANGIGGYVVRETLPVRERLERRRAAAREWLVEGAVRSRVAALFREHLATADAVAALEAELDRSGTDVSDVERACAQRVARLGLGPGWDREVIERAIAYAAAAGRPPRDYVRAQRAVAERARLVDDDAAQRARLVRVATALVEARVGDVDAARAALASSTSSTESDAELPGQAALRRAVGALVELEAGGVAAARELLADRSPFDGTGLLFDAAREVVADVDSRTR